MTYMQLFLICKHFRTNAKTLSVSRTHPRYFCNIKHTAGTQITRCSAQNVFILRAGVLIFLIEDQSSERSESFRNP
jgi:hypothetical protein